MTGLWIIPKQLHTSVSALDTKALDLGSEEFSQICEKSLTWRGKDSPSRTWLLRCKREPWMQHLFSLTLRPSHTESFVDSWTSSVAASRANPSVLLESVKALKTQDTCSLTSEMESQSADLDLFSWRTSKESSPVKQQTENQFSSMSSESWKAWVTEQRQEYSVRVKSGPLIKENGCSSWATPAAANQVGYQVSKGKKRPRLGSQVKQWPTPAARDYKGSYSPAALIRKDGKSRMDALPQVVEYDQTSWPTPTVAEGSKIGNQPNYGQKGLSNHPQIVGLPDRKKLNKSGKSPESVETITTTITPRQTGKLNPAWVEQLMGLPVGWTDLGSLVTE